MSSIFCCSSASPYRPSLLLHEDKFVSFIDWARVSHSSIDPNSGSFFQDPSNLPAFVVQFVQQINFGPLESKRYFAPCSTTSSTVTDGSGTAFVEVVEQDLITANFQKLNSYVNSAFIILWTSCWCISKNSYKNFKCKLHNKFFEVNLYQKDPLNHHHWRADIARPARDIDL